MVHPLDASVFSHSSAPATNSRAVLFFCTVSPAPIEDDSSLAKNVEALLIPKGAKVP